MTTTGNTFWEGVVLGVGLLDLTGLSPGKDKPLYNRQTQGPGTGPSQQCNQ